VDFGRHDSGVRRHQGKTPDGFHHKGPDAPSAHRRPGYPLSGCVPAEPDSVSPGSVRLASTERCGKPPSDTGVMPQKIHLYRFSIEKPARSYPHALERSLISKSLEERAKGTGRVGSTVRGNPRPTLRPAAWRRPTPVVRVRKPLSDRTHAVTNPRISD
jgi:hypothetical protein